MIAGDGRHDSMGHSAKYGTYTIFCCNNDKIIDFSLVQVILCLGNTQIYSDKVTQIYFFVILQCPYFIIFTIQKSSLAAFKGVCNKTWTIFSLDLIIRQTAYQ